MGFGLFAHLLKLNISCDIIKFNDEKTSGQDGRQGGSGVLKNSLIVCVLALALALTACGSTAEGNYTDKFAAEALNGRFSDPVLPREALEAPEATEPVVFGEEITFTWEYISSDDTMPYAVFTPSSASESEKVPLIVWLHGSGERDTNEYCFMNRGLPQVLSEWDLEGFNAYVICPQQSGVWNTESWADDRAADYVRQLIDRFVAEHNVDTDRIMIGGFSSGGKGAMYMTLRLPGYFSKLVVMSSQRLEDGDITQIKIPTIGFSECTVTYYSFMMAEFPAVFGEDSVRYYNVTHAEVPYTAFHDDQDGNNRSDLMEWLLDGSGPLRKKQ